MTPKRRTSRKSSPRFWISMCATSTAVALAIFGAALWSSLGTPVEAPAPLTPTQVAEAYGQLEMSFEANHGQIDSPVNFIARGAGYTVYLKPGETILELTRQPREGAGETAEPNQNRPEIPSVLRVKLEGTDPNAVAEGMSESAGKVNYFVGDDPEGWRTDVPTFARVRHIQAYRGIDVEYYGNQRQLEYDFVVAPGADWQQVSLRFEGADSMKVDAGSGDLILDIAGRDVRQKRPFAYQDINGERREVESSYAINEQGRVGFILGSYDPGQTLVIDPLVLSYSTFLGSGGDDKGISIALDQAGNAYVTGTTSSTEFPTTPGAFDTTYNSGTQDVFVTKLNPAGTALIYSTYIGGSVFDGPADIAVDASGNAYIIGRTESTNFPVTPGAYDVIRNGSETFITKLNTDGSALVYSTYLGGTLLDGGSGIAVNAAGEAYLAGYTNSADFPTTPGAFDTTFNGGGLYDAFVTKLNANGSGLIYSTYLGGGNGIADTPQEIAVDAAGNAYVTGVTFASDFPTTPGAFDTTFNGGSWDGFATKVNTDGTALVYSTFLGGSGDETGYGIAIDSAGNAHVVGETTSTNFPTTAGAFDTTHNGNNDAFVTKLSADGSSLVYSTFLGGTLPETGRGIAIGPSDNAYVTGGTNSPEFPTTPGAFDPTHNGLQDVYLTKLNTSGTALLWSTFLGGTGSESAEDIAVDALGNAYTTGQTSSIDLPTSPGAFDTTHNAGVWDSFIAKIADATTPTPTPTPSCVSSPSVVRTLFDFDGDKCADISVFRPMPDPADNHWYIRRSSDDSSYRFEWGIQTDWLAPADYDGDGKADIAVWRSELADPNRANFYIMQSSDNAIRIEQLGRTGDVPAVVGDWDGDGKADPAVYREGAGGGQSFFIYRTSLLSGVDFNAIPWGVTGDSPLLGDFDGDAKLDAAVFRPSDSVWYIRQSSNGQARYERWGVSTDKFVPADYDGDDKTDLAVFRDGIWYIRQSSNDQPRYHRFGLNTDTLVPADYDGDGKDDVAIYRGNGEWWQLRSSSGQVVMTQFGLSTDKPIPASYGP